MSTSPRVLFIFLDGVGIGPADPAVNPFLTARIPTLRSILKNDIPTLDRLGSTPGTALPLDALMNTPGLPQSGTGQTALLTGVDAASLYGRHFGPWVPVPLRPLMVERNLLSLARARGVSTTFANAYPREFIDRVWAKRPAGPPLAAHAAGLLTMHEEHLAAGKALSSEILNTAWRTRLGFTHIPEISPEEAGNNLADICRRASLTLFAHYSTDTAGHRRTMGAAVEALERVDRFLDGLTAALPSGTLIVLASDHGNIEDITKGHTRNPTFSLFMGPGAERMATNLTTIMDVPGAILDHLTTSE